MIGNTELNLEGLMNVFESYNAENWYRENIANSEVSDEESLIEVMARSCYKSFGVGLNPNVTKVREGNAEYLANVIDSGHGSVLEHVMINFMFQDVSRVFTHELVRHRVGVAISQESLRYVRLTELKCFDFPRLKEELTDEEEDKFREITANTFMFLEEIQKQMSEFFNLNDEQSFARKKKLTSRMRRLAPIGLLTNIGWSANFRTLRHVIPLRTSKSAEEEIRWVFNDVGGMCKEKYPNIFFDMEWFSDEDGTGLGEWRIIPKKIRELNNFITIGIHNNCYCIFIGKLPMYHALERDTIEKQYELLMSDISNYLMK
jgi:thymidylate synthase (FAD)